MTTLDPNLERIEVVASALGPLRDRVIFVGGCAAGLLISDPAATPIRATLDVDVVVNVTVLTEYHQIENEFAKLGFKRDMREEAPICRWVYRNVVVDLMPTDVRILGWSNRWYPLAVQTAEAMTLPSGLSIRLIRAPEFLGTKFEAFAQRGGGDLLASHDLEDILNVIARREQLLDEIAQCSPDLRSYLAEQCRALSVATDFEYYLPGLIQDDSSGEQSDLVMERLRVIAETGA